SALRALSPEGRREGGSVLEERGIILCEPQPSFGFSIAGIGNSTGHGSSGRSKTPRGIGTPAACSVSATRDLSAAHAQKTLEGEINLAPSRSAPSANWANTPPVSGAINNTPSQAVANSSNRSAKPQITSTPSTSARSADTASRIAAP